MLKKEENKLFDFLYSHGSAIQMCLRLSHYKLFFDDKPKNKKEAKTAAAVIRVDHKYLEAQITIMDNIKELWVKKKYLVMVEIIIHEICHILIDELYFCYEDAVEENTKKGEKMKDEKGDFYREQITEHISRWGTKLYIDFMKTNNINIKTGRCTKILNKRKSLKA